MTGTEPETPEDMDSATPEDDEISPAIPGKEPSANDKTISMLLDAAGKNPVELEPSSEPSTTGRTKTVKKILVDDQGIVADDDKYIVEDLLAKGGMGMVMAAKDVNIRRQVAVKVMLQEEGESTESLLRFVEEAQVTGQLEHPNIVPVHELGVQPGGRVFYTMKMIKGRTLKDVIKKIKDGDEATIKEFNLTRLMTVFMKVCDAVAFAHDRKVIHRDLKPENIMIGAFGEVLVVDWGLAKVLSSKTDNAVSVEDIELDESAVQTVRSDGKSDSDLHVTMDGKVMGTPRYMAPEQIRGIQARMDCRADIYSLGAILYNILTLHNHVDGNKIYDILKDTLIGKLVPIETYERTGILPHCAGNRVPAGLKAICKKCLQLKPLERYQRIEDLQKDVEAWQEGYATEAENASLIRQIGLLVARNKTVFGVSAAALLTLAVFGTTAVSKIVKERDAKVLAWKGEAEARAEAESERDKTALALRDVQRAKDELEQEHYYTTIQLVEAKIEERSFNQAHDLLWSLPQEKRCWEWGRLLKLCNRESVTITGHTNEVDSVDFSMDGTHVISTGRDRTLRIWKARTGEELLKLTTKRYDIISAAFSPDGSRFITACSDGNARVHNAQTSQELLVLKGHRKPVTYASYFPDGTRIMTLADDQTVRIWDAGSGAEQVTIKNPEGMFYSASVSSMSEKYGNRIITTSEHKVQIWDTSTGQALKSFPMSSTPFRVVFSPDSKSFLTAGTGDKTARLYDVETGRELRKFQGHEKAIYSIAFSPDGRVIATGSADKTLRLWDALRGSELRVLKGHADQIRALAYSSDGSCIASASNDKTVKVWALRQGHEVIVLGDYGIANGPRALSPDGSRVVTFNEAQPVTIRETRSGRKMFDLKGHQGHVECASFSPGGKHVVTGGEDKTAIIWDAETGYETARLTGHQGAIRSASFSTDGKRVLTASSSSVLVCDLETGQELLEIPSNSQMMITTATFSPDGKSILTGHRDYSTRLWDAESGAPSLVLKGHNHWVISAEFSPNSELIVTTSHDRTVRVWEVATGREMCVMKGPSEGVRAAVFSPDSRRVVAIGDDKTVRIWDAKTGREVITFRNFPKRLATLAFTSGETSLLVSDCYGQAMLMDVYDWHLDKEAFRAVKLNEYNDFSKAGNRAERQ